VPLCAHYIVLSRNIRTCAFLYKLLCNCLKTLYFVCVFWHLLGDLEVINVNLVVDCMHSWNLQNRVVITVFRKVLYKLFLLYLTNLCHVTCHERQAQNVHKIILSTIIVRVDFHQGGYVFYLYDDWFGVPFECFLAALHGTALRFWSMSIVSSRINPAEVQLLLTYGPSITVGKGHNKT